MGVVARGVEDGIGVRESLRRGGGSTHELVESTG